MSKAKRVLWVSRHDMHGVQMAALKRMFGDDVELIKNIQVVHNAETVIKNFKNGGYDDIIAVLPCSVLWHLTELGIKPLWADAEIVEKEEDSDWQVGNRFYRFMKFKRVESFEIKFGDLGPAAVRRDDD